jgi:hypothetical protein
MSSSPIDIVKVFYGTLSLMGAVKAAQYLSEDFRLVGFADSPMDKSAWIGLLSALKAALPDLKIRLADVSETGGQVRFTETGVGTHRSPLDLSPLGVPVIPAGGQPVTFPRLEWLLTVVGSKITRAEHVSAFPETGLAGMLAALRVQPALAG